MGLRSGRICIQVRKKKGGGEGGHGSRLRAGRLTDILGLCAWCSGQKCSAQSILFMHQNWVQAGLQDKLKVIANPQTLDLRH